MRSSGNKFKPYFFSLLATAFPNALGFLAFPLYAKALGAESYGIVALLEAYQGFFSIACFVGMTTAFYVFYSHAKEENEQKQIFATSIYFGLTILAFGLLITLFSRQLSCYLFSGEVSSAFIAIYAFSLFSDYILTIINSYLRVEGKISSLAANAILISLVHHGFSFYCVVLAGGGIASFITIFLISKATAVAISFYHIFKSNLVINLSFFDKKLLKKMINFGAPLVLTSLTGWVLLLSDRLFINYYVSMADVGIYAVGYKFAMGLWIGVVQPFMTVWEPSLFKTYKASKKQGYEKLKKDFTRYLAGIVVIYSGFILFIGDILDSVFARSEFCHEGEIIYLLAGSYFLMAIGEMCASVCRLHQTSKYAFWVTLGVILTKVCFNVVLIPSYLLIGAALASVIAELVSQTIMFLFARRLSRPYNLFFSIKNGFLVISFCLIELLVYSNPNLSILNKACVFGFLFASSGLTLYGFNQIFKRKISSLEWRGAEGNGPNSKRQASI